MDGYVCAPCMHLVSAGMGLQARLVSSTSIGVGSHGVFAGLHHAGLQCQFVLSYSCLLYVIVMVAECVLTQV